MSESLRWVGTRRQLLPYILTILGCVCLLVANILALLRAH
jgi:hypothetical protein